MGSPCRPCVASSFGSSRPRRFERIPAVAQDDARSLRVALYRPLPKSLVEGIEPSHLEPSVLVPRLRRQDQLVSLLELPGRRRSHLRSRAHWRFRAGPSRTRGVVTPPLVSWPWRSPLRRSLGLALLLEQRHVADAEAVYRADLGLDGSISRPCQHPENVWSLHGYHECLRRLGKAAEAELVSPRLQLAVARATVSIGASCFCRGAAMPAAS
jgi:hypothetical protein